MLNKKVFSLKGLKIQKIDPVKPIRFKSNMKMSKFNSKIPGVRYGPPPKSGPNPQGLNLSRQNMSFSISKGYGNRKTTNKRFKFKNK